MSLPGSRTTLPCSHQSALSSAIRAVAGSGTPACIVDARGTFLFANEAWERLPPFAGGADGGTALVGRGFAEHLPAGPLRDTCARALADAVAGRRGTRVLTGEWNDAETARLVATRLEPLAVGAEILGVVLQREIARERPVAEVYEVEDRGDAAYRGPEGVVQCACCRRVRDVADEATWCYVPRLAVDGAATALCELCAELHVGGGAA